LLVDRRDVFAAGAGNVESDARDSLDLGRAVDHRVDGLVDAVDGTLLFRPAIIDAAGQFTHDHEIEAGDELWAQRRGILEAREDSHRTKVGIQLEISAQQKERVLGPLDERLAFVLRQADAAEEDRGAALAQLARLRRECRQAKREGRPADGRLRALDVGENALQDARCRGDDFGADPVAGEERDGTNRR
jgi:hypothetical protein